LAKFELSGIPPMLAGAARIRITFALDTDGLLTVIATELTTNTSQEISVKSTYGLTADDFAAMLSKAYEHAEEDISQRLLVAATIKAQQIIAQLNHALAVDAGLLTEPQLHNLQNYLSALEEALKSGNRQLIEEKYDILIKASQDFAEKRLNMALLGKGVVCLERG
jgi:molecular chaperone HscA